MKRAKFICPKCKHIEHEKTWPYILSHIQTILTAFGLMFLIAIIIIGPGDTINYLTSSLLTSMSEDEMLNMRHRALNYTTYHGYDSFEFAHDLVAHMPDLRYARASKDKIIHNIDEVINYAGDCKEMSIYFSAMMMSLGYEAFVDCSIKDKHCVSRIPHQRDGKTMNQYMVVDLTHNSIRTYDNSVNHWKEPEKAKKAIRYAKR